MPDSTTNLKDAKARLSELVDRARAGETVSISRRGRVVAQITASPATRKPVDIQALRALRQRLPRDQQDAGELVRELRDSERY
jgi:prevent-host-death family protein